MYKTVIFDFDGTLANSIDLAVRLYNEHAESLGVLKVDKSEFPKLRKLGYKKALKEKNIKWFELPRIAIVLTKEMKKHMDEVKPYPDIVDVVKQIQNKGYRIGVLTSNNAALVQDFFKKNDFPVFDFVVSEKTLFGKDKALKKIMKRHSLDANRILYVGDETRDVIACKKVSVKVAGVTWGLAGREWLESENPDYLVSKPKEILQIIK